MRRTLEEDVLLAFLKDYKDSVEGKSNKIPKERFSQTGLCICFCQWINNSPYDDVIEPFSVLNKATGGEGYPFGGKELYDEESRKGIVHKNKQRLQFVNNHIKYLESKDEGIKNLFTHAVLRLNRGCSRLFTKLSSYCRPKQ